MSFKLDELLNGIMENLSVNDYIKSEDIPNIDLYMDQVTTFMDAHLKTSKRHDEDKILTKTMINNYAKNSLLPPPVKKKYSKDHVLMLIFIYYFKNILSISDIQTLLHPITDTYFSTSGDKESNLDLTKIYDQVLELEKQEFHNFQSDILSKIEVAGKSFPDCESEEQEFLQMFSLICTLSFDVYVKKQVIEKIIDRMSDASVNNKKERNEK